METATRPTAASATAGATGRGRRWRRVGAVLGWTCLGGSALGLTLHLLDTDSRVLVVLSSVAWLLAPLAVVAAVLLLVVRRRLWALAGVALTVAQVVAYAPLFVATTAPAGGTPVVVMSQNMLLGTADPAAIVAHVRAERVDVLALEELTPSAVAALRRAGLDAALPHSYAQPRTVSGMGTGLWSRWPLTGARAFPQFSAETLAATVTLPSGRALTVGAVHPGAPFPADFTLWRQDIDRLRALLGAATGPVVVAGDFNSTWDMARFRGLLSGGVHDAAEQAGAGLVRTWPADKPFPPVIGLDHVLTRDAVATSFATLRTPGSDHLGVVSTVVVPAR